MRASETAAWSYVRGTKENNVTPHDPEARQEHQPLTEADESLARRLVGTTRRWREAALDRLAPEDEHTDTEEKSGFSRSQKMFLAIAAVAALGTWWLIAYMVIPALLD